MPDRWLLYDDVPAGHHPGYVDRIVVAAQEIGIEPIVATPAMPPSLGQQANWIPLRSAPHRAIHRTRKQWKQVVACARAMEISTVIDLYLDKNIWAADLASIFPRRIHILHHATQYDIVGRRGLAGVRTRYLRRRLGAITRAGAKVVVHTTRARQILGDAIDDDSVWFAGYPVPTLGAVPSKPAAGIPTLIFVGASRKEKGLDILVEALPLMTREVHLRVVGAQPPGLRASIDSNNDSRIAWIDRRVTDQELWEEYSKADVAVLPYRQSFDHHGGPSSVLLETLGSGLPIVTTPGLAAQLPAHRKGSLVADDDSPQALARALDEAVAALPELTEEAASYGPEFTLRNHSYESYVATLRCASRHIRGS